MPRHIDSEPLDPAVAEQLAELEAALAGTPAADPALLTLVAEVRADAPPPSAAFRAQLDDRVASGFARQGGPREWLSSIAAKAGAERRMLLPALGVATTLIVAVVVVSAATRSSHDTPSASPQFLAQKPVAPDTSVQDQADPLQTSGTGTASLPAEVAAPSAIVASGAAPTAARRASPRPGFGRKVEHRTDLTLSTTPKDLQKTADGVVRVTQSAGGVVERSNVDSSDAGGSASFTLSVPSTRLADAIKQLSALAHVSSMSQGATDITRSFVSAAASLSDARAERSALLRALGAARTPERIAALKARLRDNRAEIAFYDGRLKSLRRRTDDTSVNVTINADRKPASTGGGWAFRDAPHDALRVLEVVAAVMLISGAILLPLGLLAAIALLTARATSRRRREQALDAG